MSKSCFTSENDGYFQGLWWGNHVSQNYVIHVIHAFRGLWWANSVFLYRKSTKCHQRWERQHWIFMLTTSSRTIKKTNHTPVPRLITFWSHTMVARHFGIRISVLHLLCTLSWRAKKTSFWWRPLLTTSSFGKNGQSTKMTKRESLMNSFRRKNLIM